MLYFCIVPHQEIFPKEHSTGIMLHVSELLAKKWAIELGYARAWYPTLMQMLHGNRSVIFGGQEHNDTRDFGKSRAESKPYFALMTTGSSTIEIDGDIKDIEKVADGTVAIIPVKGPIMREDGWSSYGTESKANFLKAIYESPNIKGVVLDINSGGGEVDGTMAFANVIKKRNKPVVALVNSIAASAAYWIAQNADTILMNDSTSQVGSIGVMMTFLDDQKYWEDMGIKWVDIIADKSQDKNKGYFDALKGKYQTIKNESLNPLREMFAQAVIDARGTKIDLEAENVLSGKMYFAAATPSGNKSAIQVGLADGIGDMEAAINQVLKLADTSKYARQTINNF